MENISQWVGIDVSKATLDVYIRPMGKAFQVANLEIEIANLVQELKIYDVNLIVLEATGGLETELIIQLPVLFCFVFLLYFLTFFLDFKFFLNDCLRHCASRNRLTIKTVATENGQGIVIYKLIILLENRVNQNLDYY